MSLIICPECGKEISDRSPQCIHCGFPLNSIDISNTNIENDQQENRFCNILGTEYDLTEIYNLLKKGHYYSIFLATSKIANGYFTKHNMQPINYLMRYIDEFDCIPTEITQEDIDKMGFHTNFELLKRWKQWQVNPISKEAYKSNTIICPKCGSASISTINRGFNIVTGFLGSGSPRNVCQKCGYKWKPKL